MSDLLAHGELSLADKLQPTDYLQGRMGALQRLHKLDPALAAEVISYAWPHSAARPWTDEEIHERLGTQRKRRAVKVAERFLGKFAETFVDSYMPSMGAAFDAFKYERMRQQAMTQAENAERFPALHFTQPVMASYAMGGGAPMGGMDGSVHHRRHHKQGEEKTALPRWQREEPNLSPDAAKVRRTAYWEHAPELSPEQLARHRDLRGRQVAAISKAEGVRPGDSPLAQLAGAHMLNDVVQLPAGQGEKLRQAVAASKLKIETPGLRDLFTATGRKAYGDRMMDAMSKLQPSGEPAPSDPTVQHALLQHELGERASARAAKSREVGSRFTASHLGETPDIAERHSLFRDPEAGHLFDELRQTNPGDAFIQKKMKQFGHTPNNPMPLGGRQHRAVAHEVLEHAPVVGQATLNRGMGVIPPIQRGVSRLLKYNPALQGIAPDVIPAALPSRVRSGLLRAEEGAQTVGHAMAKVPGLSGLYERFKAPVKSLFDAAHVSPGTPTSFMKHLSSVR